MNRIAASVLAFGCLIASSPPILAAPEQAQAIAEIENLGGGVTLDENGVAAGVDLSDTSVTDAGWPTSRACRNCRR